VVQNVSIPVRVELSSCSISEKRKKENSYGMNSLLPTWAVLKICNQANLTVWSKAWPKPVSLPLLPKQLTLRCYII